MAEDRTFALLERAINDAVAVTAARWHLRGPDAEDFAQDVRVELFLNDRRSLRRCRGGRGVFTYFCQIAHRVAADRWRREAARTGRLGIAPPEVTACVRDVSRRHEMSAEATAPVDSNLLAAHLQRGLVRVYAILTDEERQLLWRRFACGESCEAIARATGKSRSTVARRLDKVQREVHDMLCLVGVSPEEVEVVLTETRLDPGLLESADPTRPDPTRPDPTRPDPTRP